MNVTFYQAGYCRHPACILGKKSLTIAQFPNLCLHIKHPRLGSILFDTGYHPSFFSATACFPYSCYRYLTPVTFCTQETLSTQLKNDDIDPQDIRFIFLSHFHADHIAGLIDFPQAQVWCCQKSLSYHKKQHPWNNLRQGVLHQLLKPLTLERTLPIEETQPILSLQDFLCFDLLGDQSLIAVSLPGHSKGHYGLFLPDTQQGPLFLLADASWTKESLERGQKPCFITALLHDNHSRYLETFFKLCKLFQLRRDIFFIPSHCHRTVSSLRKEIPRC